MDEFVKAHNKIIFETTMESLKKNGFGGIFRNREEAANFIMNQAADWNSVGIAGTHTVRALGVVPMLEKPARPCSIIGNSNSVRRKSFNAAKTRSAQICS